MRAHSGLVFAVVLTLLGLQIATSIVEKVLAGTAIGFVGSFVLTLVGIVVGIGATVISLKLVEGKHAEYKDLLPRWGIIWRFVVAGFLVAVLVAIPVVVGILVSVMAFFAAGGEVAALEPAVTNMPPGAIAAAFVPGLITVLVALYLSLRFAAVRYAIIDGAGLVDSLRKSWHLTQGVVLKLALFALAAVAANIAGALVFMVGLLVSIPVTMLAMAHVYLKLKGRHNN